MNTPSRKAPAHLRMIIYWMLADTRTSKDQVCSFEDISS